MSGAVIFVGISTAAPAVAEHTYGQRALAFLVSVWLDHTRLTSTNINRCSFPGSPKFSDSRVVVFQEENMNMNCNMTSSILGAFLCSQVILDPSSGHAAHGVRNLEGRPRVPWLHTRLNQGFSSYPCISLHIWLISHTNRVSPLWQQQRGTFGRAGGTHVTRILRSGDSSFGSLDSAESFA